jgi:hypothetical protein
MDQSAVLQVLCAANRCQALCDTVFGGERASRGRSSSGKGHATATIAADSREQSGVDGASGIYPSAAHYERH